MKSKLKWVWCYTCNTPTGICPRCKNNSCNGTYGPLDPTKEAKEGNWCPDCPAVYAAVNVAFAENRQPEKSQCDPTWISEAN